MEGLKNLEFELDQWSLQEIASILKELGYKGYVKIWYKELSIALEFGLRKLNSYADAMLLGKFLLSRAKTH